MGNLFGVLLGTESEATLEIFLTLRRASNQVDGLKAAAKFRLAGESAEIFAAIMLIYTSLEKQRNDLAHGCFGICADDPSVLLWIDVKHHVHFQMEVHVREKSGDLGDDLHARLKRHLFVYRVSDLDTLYAEMDQFRWILFHFLGYLRYPHNDSANAEFSKLKTYPLVAQAISAGGKS